MIKLCVIQCKKEYFSKEHEKMVGCEGILTNVAIVWKAMLLIVKVHFLDA